MKQSKFFQLYAIFQTKLFLQHKSLRTAYEYLLAFIYLHQQKQQLYKRQCLYKFPKQCEILKYFSLNLLLSSKPFGDFSSNKFFRSRIFCALDKRFAAPDIYLENT